MAVADSTLKRMKKDELIQYIRVLERRKKQEEFIKEELQNIGAKMKERCDKCLKGG